MKRSIHSFFSDKTIVSIIPLAHALSNEVYRVDTDKGVYVYRKKRRGTMSRRKECSMQTQAALHGLAPQVCFCDHAVMITPWIQATHKRTLKIDDITELARTLRRVHRLSKHHAPVRDLSCLIRAKTPEVISAFQTVARSPKQFALCHHDLNPFNVLFGDQGVVLIDWEYAGVNDVYFDLAAVCVEFGLTANQERHLMRAYTRNATYHRAKLDAYQTLYKQVCVEWLERL